MLFNRTKSRLSKHGTIALNIPGLVGDSLTKFPWRTSCAHRSSWDKENVYVALDGSENGIGLDPEYWDPGASEK